MTPLRCTRRSPARRRRCASGLGHESYENKLQKKGERLSTAQLGVDGVKEDITKFEEEVLDELKRGGSGWAAKKGRAAAGSSR